MALNTWHVALSDPNDPGSDRVLVMTEDEVRDTYPQFAGRPTQFVDRDGVRVHVEDPLSCDDFGTALDECGEDCLTHASGCDGFCDHQADHTNACLLV